MANIAASFLSGAFIGLLVTAPVGPICILCIQRTLACGRVEGVGTGFGSAIALSIYGACGAWGASSILSLPSSVQFSIRGIGAGVLFFLSWKLFRSARTLSSPSKSGENMRTIGVYPAAVSTFLLEIVNPASIMIFVGLFSAYSFHAEANLPSILSIGAGIFISSMIWWIFLCCLVDYFRCMVKPELMGWANRFAGGIILLYGLHILR